MPLRSYQNDGVRFLETRGRCILADEPGLGKTAQLLTAAEGRTLVVSPAMLEDVWVEEHQKWRPDLDMEWVSYSSLCEREGRKVKPVPKPEFRGGYDTIIFDESHYLKERKTNWTKAALKLKSDRLFLATGTPLPNWAHEIYTSLAMVHRDQAKAGQKYGSYWRWVEYWFDTQQSRFNQHARDIGDLRPFHSWDTFATDNGLDQCWLRRERNEVLTDLPPLTQQSIMVEMTPEQRKVYNQVKKELYAEIEDTGHEIISWSKSGVHTKLLKLSTGIESEDPEYGKDGGKIKALREIMEGRNHPTLEFTMFRASAEAAADRLRQDGFTVEVVSGAYSLTDRKDRVRRFRQGQIDVIVGTLGTISEGLTLTAADTCIFLERDARPSKNEQALRRIHRMGQERPCLSIDLVTSGTVDAGLLKLLGEKTDQQMAAMTAFDLAALV